MILGCALFFFYPAARTVLAVIHVLNALCFDRYADQPVADHGKTRVGPVHPLQIGRPERRYRGGHHQEVVAGDHPGLRPAPVHNERRVHVAYTVSTTACDLTVTNSCTVGHEFVDTCEQMNLASSNGLILFSNFNVAPRIMFESDAGYLQSTSLKITF